MIEECAAIAQQAPNGSNLQRWHFVVVTDADKRAALADLYKRGAEYYFEHLPVADDATTGMSGNATMRLTESAFYLVEHIHEVPVHVIPCISGRTDGLP
ncbi:MAG TPA: nitroreductase family protein, partial [Nitrososphaerales archaeon]|nr:nitroreductase family protein [Nitrososphaerales archaeon]